VVVEVSSSAVMVVDGDNNNDDGGSGFPLAALCASPCFGERAPSRVSMYSGLSKERWRFAWWWWWWLERPDPERGGLLLLLVVARDRGSDSGVHPSGRDMVRTSFLRGTGGGRAHSEKTSS